MGEEKTELKDLAGKTQRSRKVGHMFRDEHIIKMYLTRCGRKVMRLATLCTNRQRCCLPLHIAVRSAPAVDSVQG